VLTGAVKDGLLESSPLSAIPWRKVVQRGVRPLTPQQVDDIGESIYPRWRAAVLVVGYGGLRIGELGGLRDEDIHLSSGRVFVRRVLSATGGVHIGEPKTAAAKRAVTLPRSLSTSRRGT